MIYERMFREFLIWSSMEEKDWNYSTLRILAGHLKIRFLEEPSDDFWNNPRNVYGRILGKFLKESSEISDWFLEGFLKHFFLENRLKSSHVFRTNSWSNYEKKNLRLLLGHSLSDCWKNHHKIFGWIIGKTIMSEGIFGVFCYA